MFTPEVNEALGKVLEKYEEYRKWGYNPEDLTADEINLVKLANCMMKTFRAGKLFEFFAPVIYARQCQECPMVNNCPKKVSA